MVSLDKAGAIGAVTVPNNEVVVVALPMFTVPFIVVVIADDPYDKDPPAVKFAPIVCADVVVVPFTVFDANVPLTLVALEMLSCVPAIEVV